MECKKHGLSFVAPICQHLADAMRALMPLDPIPLVNQHDEVYLLCETCCVDLLIPPKHGWLDDGPEGALFEPHRIRCVCEECLEAWFAITGQGTIEETSEEARGRQTLHRPCR